MKRGAENRQGAMARRLAIRWYWMWRKGLDYEQVKKFGSPRGPARNRQSCAVEHRVIDWAARSSLTEEYEVVIMIEVVTEVMHGSD